MGLGVEELQAVERVMKSGCLSGYQGNWSDNFYGGPEIQALEKEWAQYFGVKHAIACNSNSSGLWMACNALGIGPHDEVLVTPYSMTISASVPLLFGAEPIFVDIEPDYFCMDPNDIIKKISPRTKAIIAVDLFGQPCNYARIQEIANVNGIKLIVDAAQSPGAKYKNKYCGKFGDIGVYSLNFHKHIHCGEGGIVVTDDDDLALKLRLSMNHGEAVINDISSKTIYQDFKFSMYERSINMIGMNLRMTELSAAIAREQLKKLEGILEKYRFDAQNFPVKVREDAIHSYYRYAFVPDNKVEDDFWMTFNDDNFLIKQGYITPIFKMPLFQELGYSQKQCPNVQNVNDKIILAWRREPY